MVGIKSYGKEATAVVRPDYRFTNKDGKHTLHIYVSYDNKDMDWSVKIYVTRTEWAKISSENLRDERLREIKAQVNALEAKAKSIIREMKDAFNFEDFYTLFFGKLMKKSANKQHVICAIDEKIKELEPEQIGTIKLYVRLKESLSQYCEMPLFKDIDPKFLIGFEKHILDQGLESRGRKNSVNTAGMLMRNLRHIMGRALEQGIISQKQYPFGVESKGKYQIPSAKGGKKPLDVEDVILLLKYKPQSIEQQWGYDFWFLIFECNGINPTDIFNLKNKDIEGDFLRFYRQKTIRTRKSQELIEIYITPQSREIIERWRNKGGGPNDFVFNVYDNTMDAAQRKYICSEKVRIINNHITKISKRMGISKGRITTYVARHTWATYMEHQGVPITYIQKGLGHSTLATTTSYLEDLNLSQKKDVSIHLTDLHTKAKKEVSTALDAL